MKFTKIDGHTAVGGPMVGRTVWTNDNQSCFIVSCDRTTWPNSPEKLWVYASLGSTVNTTGVYCARDGVVAFVVKEMMDIASQHGCDGPAHGFKLTLMEFIRALRPTATLGSFHAYKESQK